MAAYVTPLPLDGGVALDIGDRGNWIGLRGKAILTVEIRDSGDARHVTGRYRHPSSARATIKRIRLVGRRCFPESLGLEK